jgi:hypothetical protein
MRLIECGSPYHKQVAGSPIKSVHSFLAEINTLVTSPPMMQERLYFRGDEETLKPHIGKAWYYGDKGGPDSLISYEWRLLHRFRRFTNPHVNVDNAWWETLFLARHHGLPTRLLDWSTNPLVALYFALGLRAINEKPSGVLTQKYVWAISLHPVRADIDVLKSCNNPLDLTEIPLVGGASKMDAGHEALKIVFPVYNSHRITAQHGIFTWQSNPGLSIDSYAQKPTTLPDQNLDIAKLYCWSVPTELAEVTSLMQELRAVGIDAATISPDLDGVCRSLVEAQLLFG